MNALAAKVLTFIIWSLTPFSILYKVSLDYSLKSYLEVMFLNTQMKITVQGSPVNNHTLYFYVVTIISRFHLLYFFLGHNLSFGKDSSQYFSFVRGNNGKDHSVDFRKE
jgi:hypothetical protein